jgi:hypothetical protein
MTGVIEDLSWNDREPVLMRMAAALRQIVDSSSDGKVNLLEALRNVARQFQTLVSQIRYGLDYAIDKRMVRIDDEMLVATA